MEKIAYFNQPNCYKLTNGTVEVIVTTDIGPRILRYSFLNEENILAELPATVTKTAFGDWHAYGGHRLWLAPEAMPRSYSPDGKPLEFKIEGKYSIRLMPAVEPETGIQKEMLITLDPTGTGVHVNMELTNHGLWAVDVAPWGITIMNGGGMTIIPQEPYISHNDKVEPARPMVLWHYTDLNDTRWKVSNKYIQLKTDEAQMAPQKVGVLNKQGWAAYSRNKTLFVKRFPCNDGLVYPDYGCNNETYTSGDFMEIETLAPIKHLENGESTEYSEHWFLFKNVDIGATETELDETINPLIQQTL